MATGKKTGGRQKGTPNKMTRIERSALISYCEQNGANPFKFWADILAGNIDPDHVKAGIDAGLSKTHAFKAVLECQLGFKNAAAKNLAPYLMPQLRQQELKFTQSQAQEKVAELLGIEDEEC